MAKPKFFKIFLLIVFSLLGLAFFSLPIVVSANHTGNPDPDYCAKQLADKTIIPDQHCVDNEEDECTTGKDTTKEELQACLESNSIITLINNIVNFLTAGVGIVVIIMVIVSGIQYSAAQDDPQKVKKAKAKAGKAIGALLAYLLMGAFLQWIIPGGIF